jgi:hypothetical protein
VITSLKNDNPATVAIAGIAAFTTPVSNSMFHALLQEPITRPNPLGLNPTALLSLLWLLYRQVHCKTILQTARFLFQHYELLSSTPLCCCFGA